MVNIEDRGLLLKVRGNHHKGYVFVTLGYEDLYQVHIISTQGNIKESINGIFFDVLQGTIDSKVERIPEYRY